MKESGNCKGSCVWLLNKVKILKKSGEGKEEFIVGEGPWEVPGADNI